MDFKRIEWIFLVVFIGINIFLGIELWQTPTLLSAGSTPAQTDIKSETSADQITIPKVNDKQEDGYYLAAKVDNSWTKKAAAQVNQQVETNASENSISVNLSKPIALSKDSKKALKEIIHFKNNSQNVYEGKDYVYLKGMIMSLIRKQSMEKFLLQLHDCTLLLKIIKLYLIRNAMLAI